MHGRAVGLFCLLVVGVAPGYASQRCTTFVASPLEWVGYPRPLTAAQAAERGKVRQIGLTAAAGQVEPFSVVIFADGSPLRSAELHVTPLSNGRERIGAAAFDAHWVVRWYRGLNSAWYGGDGGRRLLVPQILLKNPRLIAHDHNRKLNLYQWEGADEWGLPQDAETLQPLDVPAGEWAQAYVRLSVPPAAEPGVYRGTVAVRFRDDVAAQTFELVVTVPNIALLASCKDFHVWSHMALDERLPDPLPPGTAAEGPAMNVSRYAAALRRFASDGWQPSFSAINEASRRRAIRLWKLAGFGRRAVIGDARPADWVEAGFPGSYRYVDMDTIEDHGQEAYLREYRVLAARGVGVCQTGLVWSERAAQWIDAPVFEGDAPGKAAYTHRIKPQTGRALVHDVPMLTLPWAFNLRLQYGFWLWSRGFDGAFPYVGYTNSQAQNFWLHGNAAGKAPWGLLAPARNGFIETTSWQALRDAVTDTRYLTTLTAQLVKARQLEQTLSPPAASAVARAEEFQRTLPGLPRGAFYGEAMWGTTRDRDGSRGYAALQTLRGEVLQHILTLQDVHPALDTRRLYTEGALNEECRLYSLRGRTCGEDSLGWVTYDMVGAARRLARQQQTVVEDLLAYSRQVENLVLFDDGELKTIRDYATQVASRVGDLQASRVAEARVHLLVGFLDAARSLSESPEERRTGTDGERFLRDMVKRGVLAETSAAILAPWCGRLGYSAEPRAGLESVRVDTYFGQSETIFIQPGVVRSLLDVWDRLELLDRVDMDHRDAAARALQNGWLAPAEAGRLQSVVTELARGTMTVPHARQLARRQPYGQQFRSGDGLPDFIADLMRLAASHDVLLAAGEPAPANRLNVAFHLRLNDALNFGFAEAVEPIRLHAPPPAVEQSNLEEDFETVATTADEKWEHLHDVDGLADEMGWPDDPTAVVAYDPEYLARFQASEGWHWHRTAFEAPARATGRRGVLIVGGLDVAPATWLNGQRLRPLFGGGGGGGGRSPAVTAYDLSGALREGLNRIVFRTILHGSPTASVLLQVPNVSP